MSRLALACALLVLAAAPVARAQAGPAAPPIGAKILDDKGKPVGQVEHVIFSADGRALQVEVRVDRVLRTLPVEALTARGHDYVAALSRAEIAALPPSD